MKNINPLGLFKDEGQPLYADSAYKGKNQETVYKKKKVINKINEKG